MGINFKKRKFSLRVLLSICLIFCQFQPGVAYKSVAYKKACKLIYINLILVKKSFTYLTLFWMVSLAKAKLKLNKTFSCFNFDISFKTNLVLFLGFKAVNVKISKYCNVNIFQLINFCDCRIPNQQIYLCKTLLLQKID